MSTLWYFAYGSNLDARTFVGRRRMQPRETRIGVLADFELRFDLLIGPGERGVANVVPCKGNEVWGVLYLLTHQEAERLDRTEGVPHGAYQRLVVEIQDAAGTLVNAFTYHSERGRAGRKPSRRYLGLLISGALQHGLPARYIQHLQGFPLAIDEREAQLPLFPPASTAVVRSED